MLRYVCTVHFDTTTRRGQFPQEVPLRNKESPFKTEDFQVFASSAIAGFLASAFSLPFDFVKTQMQKQKPDPKTGILMQKRDPKTGTETCSVV